MRKLVMAARLDQIPALALRPSSPRGRLWVGLLLLFLTLGLAAAWLFVDQSLAEQPVEFWILAAGIPCGCWCLLFLCRAIHYLGLETAANGWNQAREEHLSRTLQIARRHQHVLDVSLYTALRADDQTASEQLDALLNDTKALKTQPCRQEGIALHSRLAGEESREPKQVVRETLLLVLTDLAKTLDRLPEQTSLALLLEVDSALSEADTAEAWREAWQAAGIRQSATPLNGRGLEALDQWLDERSGDPALLLVVALQVAPQLPANTAEVAVGLLLGNPGHHSPLTSMACLHRPEQEGGAPGEGLRQAADLALNWVPVASSRIEHVWRVGIAAQREASMTTVTHALELSTRHATAHHNLDTLLGYPGKAAPWLAIAAASQALQRGAGPQFIFSGEGADASGLWGTVLMPVPPIKQQEF